MSDEERSPAGKIGKSGQILSSCGRPSFSANTINKKFNCTYRNSENTHDLGGKLLNLGRAAALAAMIMFGFDVSLEDAANKDR